MLRYYEQELSYIKEAAAEFAERHPKIAGRLQIGDSLQDPWVERLLSGIAFLNARTQKRLDDDFSELSDAMLNVLYPHYLNPIPSLSIIHFEPADDMDSLAFIDKETPLQTDPANGERCQFKTCYPVSMAPLSVKEAKLMARPFVAPGADRINNAGAVLQIKLQAVNKELKIGELGLDKLRFFLRGQPQHTYPLHELILNQAVKVVIAKTELDSQPVFLNPHECIEAVGFDTEEGLIPYPDNAFLGYRLLTEFFVFPDKFLFTDFTNLAKHIPEDTGNEINLFIYLKSFEGDLEHQIDADNFLLNCSPIVNLFEHTADPISLDQQQHKYRVIPDNRRKTAMEVYSVLSVKATDKAGEEYVYTPFYGLQHGQSSKNHGTFWYPKRNEVIEGEHKNEMASEVDLTLINVSMTPEQPIDQTLNVHLLCNNRNLPSKLPQGGGQPRFYFVEGGAPTKAIKAIVPPTSTLRQSTGKKSYWRLISHLNLNYLSLTGDKATEILKEIMRLYDFRDSSSTRTMIQAIQKVKTQVTSAPIRFDKSTVLCRGTEVEITFDPRMLTGSSAYLFSAILNHYLSLYCSINSFTRLVAKQSGRDEPIKKWSPRAGDKALI